MFTAIDRANLTVHSLDPSGLSTVPIAQAATRAAHAPRRNTTRNPPASGRAQGPAGPHGRADGDERERPRPLGRRHLSRERFVLSAWIPAGAARSANGTFHAITVKANRRGLDVRARSGYTASCAPERDAAPSPTAGNLPDSHTSRADGAPPSERRARRCQRATFAMPGSEKGRGRPFGGRGRLCGVVGRTGRDRNARQASAARGRGERVRSRRPGSGTARQTLELSPTAATPTARPALRCAVAAGSGAWGVRVRVAVSAAEPPRTASVFTYVTVPPFDAAPLSLSNIVVGATAGTLTAPKDFLSTVLPIVPTGAARLRSRRQAGGVSPASIRAPGARIRCSRCSCGCR